jgi:hypothetical protein
MARIDGPSSGSILPPIDTTPVEKAQPAEGLAQVDSLQTAVGTGAGNTSGAQSLASSNIAKPPLTDPTEKSVVLLRFSQTAKTGETTKSGATTPTDVTPSSSQIALGGHAPGH